MNLLGPYPIILNPTSIVNKMVKNSFKVSKDDEYTNPLRAKITVLAATDKFINY